MYAVTDRCSFSECSRLKFLINSFCKKSKKSNSDNNNISSSCVLVGNQNDRTYDRMVSEPEGRCRASELGCSAFYEISVRETVDNVVKIFEDLYSCHRKVKKYKPSLHKQYSVPAAPSVLAHDYSDSGDGSDPEKPSRSLSRRRAAYYTIS